MPDPDTMCGKDVKGRDDRAVKISLRGEESPKFHSTIFSSPTGGIGYIWGFSSRTFEPPVWSRRTGSKSLDNPKGRWYLFSLVLYIGLKLLRILPVLPQC